MLPKADYCGSPAAELVMWQVISHGEAGRMLTAVSKKNLRTTKSRRVGWKTHIQVKP